MTAQAAGWAVPPLWRGSVRIEPLSLALLDLDIEAFASSRAAIATFWLIDDQMSRPSAAVVLGDLEDWTMAWCAAPVVFRC